MQQDLDWAAVAREHADAVAADRRVAAAPARDRRGAVWLSPGLCLAYAADRPSGLEVTLLRQALDDAGLPELGFGVGRDGRAWAMVVRTDAEQALHAAVLDAWRIARS